MKNQGFLKLGRTFDVDPVPYHLRLPFERLWYTTSIPKQSCDAFQTCFILFVYEQHAIEQFGGVARTSNSWKTAATIRTQRL